MAIRAKEFNMIVVGGCHVAGYKLQNEPSFVDIVANTLHARHVSKKSYFSLDNVHLLDHYLTHYDSDIVILQLGNNEFSPSFKKIFHLQWGENIHRKNTTNHRINASDSPFIRHSWPLECISQILSPLRWIYGIVHYKKDLQKLCGLVQRYPHKIFVIITPFPRYGQNFSRWRAGVYYKHLYMNFPNVLLVDSFKEIPAKKENFYDVIHLNGQGHRLLGEAISKKIIHLLSLWSVCNCFYQAYPIFQDMADLIAT